MKACTCLSDALRNWLKATLNETKTLTEKVLPPSQSAMDAKMAMELISGNADLKKASRLSTVPAA